MQRTVIPSILGGTRESTNLFIPYLLVKHLLLLSKVDFLRNNIAVRTKSLEDNLSWLLSLLDRSRICVGEPRIPRLIMEIL